MKKENYIEMMSEKELGMFLPKQMKETEVLSTEAKKVLAVLVEGFALSKKARESGFLIATNETIRSRAGVNGSGLMKGIRELQLYNLIERNKGSRWQKGVEKKASEYIVNWENITKELKQKTYEDLIEEMGLSLLSTSTSSFTSSFTSSSSSNSTSLSSSTSKSSLSSSKEINNNIDKTEESKESGIEQREIITKEEFTKQAGERGYVYFQLDIDKQYPKFLDCGCDWNEYNRIYSIS